MNKITKAAASAGTTLAVLMGGAVAANAVTDTVRYANRCVGSSLWAVTETYHDFNWLEELQGKRDYVSVYYRYRIAFNHPACTGQIYV